MIFRLLFRGAEEKYGQLIEESAAAQARIKSGESEEEEVVSPDGTVLRMRRVEGGGIHFASVGGEVETFGQRFQETEERPSSYPGDAPFFPEVQVSVTEIPQNGWRSISWHRISDPTRMFDEIGKRLSDQGWVAGRKRRLVLGLLGVEKEFTKEGVTQRLVLQRLPGGKRKLQLIRRSEKRSGSDAS